MQNLVLMAEGSALEQLKHETPDSLWRQGTAVSILVHILLEILLAVFEDEDEFGLRVDNVMQANDVDMLELLHEGYFTDSGGRGSFFCI